MKFKEYKTPFDCSIIAEDYQSAPIDEKNVCTDWIDEYFFDSYATNPDNRQEYVGYVGNQPVMLRYSSTCVIVHPYNGINGTTEAVVLNRLAEIFTNKLNEGEDNELIALCRKLTDQRKQAWFITFITGKYIGK